MGVVGRNEGETRSALLLLEHTRTHTSFVTYSPSKPGSSSSNTSIRPRPRQLQRARPPALPPPPPPSPSPLLPQCCLRHCGTHPLRESTGRARILARWLWPQSQANQAALTHTTHTLAYKHIHRQHRHTLCHTHWHTLSLIMKPKLKLIIDNICSSIKCVCVAASRCVCVYTAAACVCVCVALCCAI